MPKKLNTQQKTKLSIESFSSMTLEEQNAFIKEAFYEFKEIINSKGCRTVFKNIEEYKQNQEKVKQFEERKQKMPFDIEAFGKMSSEEKRKEIEDVGTSLFIALTGTFPK